MLEVSNLSLAYGDVQVLWDISFTVNPGQIVVLLGANGAGKTTTIKAISGILPIKSGSIIYEGQELQKLNTKDIVDLGIIQVPEGRKLFPDMTVEENLIAGSLSHRAKPKRKENLERCYEIFPKLYERRKQMAGTLSGGEQQMCAIGRGIMAEPKLLMLDEPSLGLAPIIVQDIFKIIKEINETGTSILLVEQNVKQSLAIGDVAFIIENGKIVHSGKCKDLENDNAIRQAYLGI